MSVSILDPSSWAPDVSAAFSKARNRIPWVAQNPQKAQKDAEAAGAEIRAARVSLDRWKALLPKTQTTDQDKAEWAAFSKASVRWYSLASAFYQDGVNIKTGKPVEKVGFAPIVVGVVAIAIAAAAFAPSAFELARSIKKDADTRATELAARVRAMDEGKTLQTYTGPPPEPPKAGLPVGMIVGGLVVVTLGIGIAVAVRR